MDNIFGAMHAKRDLRRGIAKGKKGTIIAFEGDNNEIAVVQLDNGGKIRVVREPFYQIGSQYFFVHTDGGSSPVPF